MNQSQIHVPELTKINKYLIITSVSIFLLGAILSKAVGLNLLGLLGLSAKTFSSGLIHQIITYPFVSGGLLEVVFECMILWFIGSELEGMWGSKRYLMYLGSVVIGGGLVYLVISFLFFSGTPIYGLPLKGLAGIASAMCLSYAIIFPNRLFTFMFLFPVKAKYFCALLIGMSLFTGVFTPMGAGAWGHLASMGCAFAFMLYVSKEHMKQTVDLMGDLKKKVSKKTTRKKNHLTLVDNEEERPPKYWQ